MVGLRETIDKPRIDDHKEYLTGSSQYASAESEVMSDESMDMRRMSLGPTGATFLRDQITSIKAEPTPVIAPVITNNMSLGQMQKLFTGAMEKFMKEQRQIKSEDRMGRSQNEKTSQDFSDVEMESVGSRHDQPNEYDFDDLMIEEPRRPLVATTETLPGSGVSAQRIRVSAISDLKEFAGKDRDEDRAISWIGKVKSAFLRDQAPDSEKCIVFGDLLIGPARNWYHQLSRSTRNSWKSLLEGFLEEYCGRGVSVGQQYYSARKRRMNRRWNISTG